MKKHIPNTITLINLAIGSYGVYYTLMDDYTDAIYFVIAAGLFDFFDGFVARILKVKSEIGKQLDSLADLVSFGLLPTFFMLKWMEGRTEFFLIALIIVLFSALRLAKFNVDDTQSDHFKGLPTPANAIMLTSLIFVPFELYDYTMISICVLSAVLLVSPTHLLALKFTTFGWQGNQARWVLIGGSILMMALFQWAFVPVLIPFYIVVSIVSMLIK